MFIVGIRTTLRPGRTATPDEVADLIESIVDALDDEGFDADVSTRTHNDAIDLRVEVIVRKDDAMDAQVTGFDAMRRALGAAGVRSGKVVVPGGIGVPDAIESSTRVLTPA